MPQQLHRSIPRRKTIEVKHQKIGQTAFNGNLPDFLILTNDVITSCSNCYIPFREKSLSG